MLTFPDFEPHFSKDDWTLPRILEHQAQTHPDRPFLSWTDAGHPWTFQQTNEHANRIAHGFLKAGVKKGDLVAILLPNCLEFIFAWFGLSKIGAVEVAISTLNTGRFLAHPLRLSQARILIADVELANRVLELQEGAEHLEKIFLVGTPEELDNLQNKAPQIQVRPFAELISDTAANPDSVIKPGDPAAVLMTSGTTGPSKGVVMRHSQMYFFAEEDVQLTRLTKDDVYMTGFPLFHGNAQFLTVYPCLIAGAHCVLYERFSASDWSGRAYRSGATVTNLIGATMSFILDKPPLPEDRLHHVRCIYAAPLAPDLGRRFTERFGVNEYVDGFGQTEISNVFMTPPDAQKPNGASGVLVDQWFEVLLVDPESEQPVPHGKPGELWVRPKAPGIVAYEYLGMPERTVEAWRDLWFHTGDVLRMDDQGWYYFVDRVKDALRRRGENISSFEVEEVVNLHPNILQSAVIGVNADEDGGENEIMVFIIKDESSPSYESIAQHCLKEMPEYMAPRYFEFIDALPVTATGKIKKNELRERGVGPQTWDRLGEQQ